MALLVAKKLVQLVLVVFLVTLFTFLLVQIKPGEPEDLLVPLSSVGTTEEAKQTIEQYKADIRADLDLDKPLYEQYGRWLGNFVTGDLGSYYAVSSQRPVSERVGDSLPVSLQLMVYAQVLALAVAIPAGVYSAYRANKPIDKAANTTAFGMLAMPNFALGLILAYYVGVKLGWVPPTGYTAPEDNLVDHAKSMFLPALSLAVGQIAIYMRLLRSDMIQTLQEDFILMAKSKGISNARVLWRHALRPSSLTLLTVAGLNVGALIGGAVVIEVVFALPGMGFLIAEAILSNQIIALQSCVAIIAIGYVLINFLLDFLYTVLDPRIRNVRAG
jgi:peptide/nickel transport system permease protein